MMNIINALPKYLTRTAILIFVCVCFFDRHGPELFAGLDVFPALSFMNKTKLGLIVHFVNVHSFYSRRRSWPTTKLGAILFKGDKYPDRNVNENRTFSVLIWKEWMRIKHRHVYNYNLNKVDVNILENCSVNNCFFSGDESLIKKADAVVVWLQRNEIPKIKRRNPKQRWIFLNEESAVNAFARRKIRWKDLNGVFNWSMTYRNDADVPIPYGRTIPLDEPIKLNPNTTDISALVPNWELKQRDVPATILISHCGVKGRDKFLNKLMQYIKVDVYGKCSKVWKFKKVCPGHYKTECDITSRYLFYLALENSQCFQYLSEKAFQHAYERGAVPIIWGPRYEDVRTLLPPNSFLYADENTDVQLLAREIIALTKNDDLLLSMHEWRNHFKVVNEHGFFGTKSYHLCRLCEALNYNDEKKKILSLKDMQWFLDTQFTCTNL